jgi:Type IV pilus assembly protein PilM
MDFSLRMSLKFSWFGRSDGWTAIDCQGGLFCVSVKLPHKLGVLPLVVKKAALPGAILNKENLIALSKLMGNQGFPIANILNTSEYQLFLLDKAAVKSDEMESSLRWTLSPLLDYPTSELNVSWLEIPKSHSRSNAAQQIHVIAARNEMVNQRMELFDKASIPLKVIDIRETG